jgi:hypothetical protein
MASLDQNGRFSLKPVKTGQNRLQQALDRSNWSILVKNRLQQALERSIFGQIGSKPGQNRLQQVDFWSKPGQNRLQQAIFWSKQAIFGSCGRGGGAVSKQYLISLNAISIYFFALPTPPVKRNVHRKHFWLK